MASAGLPTAPQPPLVVVVMGVCGAGKSTLAARLASALDAACADGDDFHPQANRDKMRAGRPLDDEDRAPWLAAVAAFVGAHLAAGTRAVVSCSALKRKYRDVIGGGGSGFATARSGGYTTRVGGDAMRECSGARLVFLHGARELLAARLAARVGHYMPPALLDSQLAILEPPEPDEGAVVVDVDAAEGEVLEAVLRGLGLGSRCADSVRRTRDTRVGR